MSKTPNSTWFENPTEAQRYIYEKFDSPRQIRLLQAWVDHQIKRMTVRFTHVDLTNLDEETHYRAFSCCWGDPIPVEKAWFVDGSYLEVSASAASIIRTVAKDSENRSFNWIDAVCINQEKLNEKGRSYEVVTQCYIHGLMNGDGLELGDVEMIRLI